MREDEECLSRHKDTEETMDHFDKLSKEEKLRNIALDYFMVEVIGGSHRWKSSVEVIHGLDRSGI